MLFDRRFFSVKTSPNNLAIFRIFFFFSLFFQISRGSWLSYAQAPDALRLAPVGVSWFVSSIPISPELVSVAIGFFYLFAFLGMIGLYSRTSALLTAIISFYLLGIPNFFGSVCHNHHHIISFAIILACSRCGDSFSVDSYLSRSRIPEPSVIYTVPIRLIWIMFGVIYFFPGFWKFYYSGLDWALGKNMYYIFHSKWKMGDALFTTLIEQHPIVYQLAGLGTLFFELFFIVLLFIPVVRYIPIVMGFVFHICSYFFIGINFLGLACCYAVFVNWDSLIKRIGFLRNQKTSPSYPFGAQLVFVILVGSLLIGGNVYRGVELQSFSWPFACYPTFKNVRSPNKAKIRLVLLDADRNQIQPSSKKVPSIYGGKKFNSTLRKVIKIKDENEKKERMRAFIDLWKGSHDDVAYVQFYRDTYPVVRIKKERKSIHEKFLEEIAL